jgi:hypothetical protein
VIEFEYELSHGQAKKPAVSHEPDNGLWLYRVDGSALISERAEPVLGLYHSLNFVRQPGIIGDAVTDFGIKHLPRFGAIAFYTLPDGRSFVLCPLHDSGD